VVRQTSLTGVAATAGVLAGLLLDFTIAIRFGAKAPTDAFFVAARIPLGLVAVVMVVANQALVPAFRTSATRRGERPTDHLISIDDVRRFRDCLERHGKSFRIHLYPDAPHGWLNDTMPGRYRRAQAEAAWAEQRAFLDEVLSPGYDRTRRAQRYEADIAVDYDFSRNVRQE